MAHKGLSIIRIPALAIAATLAFAPIAFAQTTTTTPSNDSATASTTTPPAANSSATEPSSTTGTARNAASGAAQDVKDGAHRAAAGAKHVYHSAKAKVKDATLDARVITALHDNKETHGADIHVSSDHGLVTLSGTVPSKETAERAHEIAGQIIGVKEVRNELKYANADMNDSTHSNESGSHTTDGAAGTENDTPAN